MYIYTYILADTIINHDIKINDFTTILILLPLFFSLDDIDLWARLRSMTLIRGLTWPAKLGSYMRNLSERGDVPLYFSMQV